MESITSKEWESCLRVLQIVSENPDVAAMEHRFKSLIKKIYTKAKRQNKSLIRQERRDYDRALLEATGRCRMEPPLTLSDEKRQSKYISTGSANTLQKSRSCYICKSKYHALDQFYHLLCPECALKNHVKRKQRIDLSGRTAVVTGGRIKIGYELVLKFLRDGAHVIATTRFPIDAVKRISREPDFDQFQRRILFFGLDFRHLPSVEQFIAMLKEEFSGLDILVNNAAQTICRPANFYQALMAQEDSYVLPETQKLLFQKISTDQTTCLLEHTHEQYFPEAHLDHYGQPLDTRPANSWTATLHDVSTVEFVEAQVINYFVPFMLASRLKPLMQSSKFSDRYIVNVSAMEGQFGRDSKTSRHPHTNMAKAALNMMTRTTASDYAESGIYMNSVDTGWITNENPYDKSQRSRLDGFVPPLDLVDGAARIYDPIIKGIGGDLCFGKFLKDYEPFPW